MENEQKQIIYKFRRAQLEDNENIVKIVTEAFNTGKSWTDETKYVSSERTNHNQIEKLLNKKNIIIFVLEDFDNENEENDKENLQDPKMIATVQVALYDTISWMEGYDRYSNNKKIIYISLLSVLPEYQSKGLGKKIMNFVESYIRILKYYLENNNNNDLNIDNYINENENFLYGYKINFDNDEFFLNNYESLKDVDRFAVQFNDERMELDKFYTKFGYINTGFKLAASKSTFNFSLKQDFNWVLYEKIISFE
jgi:GNAT superfamily N-acetyltransferase